MIKEIYVSFDPFVKDKSVRLARQDTGALYRVAFVNVGHLRFLVRRRCNFVKDFKGVFKVLSNIYDEGFFEKVVKGYSGFKWLIKFSQRLRLFKFLCSIYYSLKITSTKKR